MTERSSPPSRRVRLEHDDRRDRILASAQRMFAERPYESVSTTEVAEAAGTTRTNLHYYFGTKHNLLLEVVRRFAELRLPLPAVVTPPDDEQSRAALVAQTLELWLDLVEENAETFLVLVRSPAIPGESELQAMLDRSMASWGARLVRLIGGDPADPLHRAAIRAYQAMVQNVCEQWLRTSLWTKREVRSLLTRTALAVGDYLHTAGGPRLDDDFPITHLSS